MSADLEIDGRHRTAIHSVPSLRERAMKGRKADGRTVAALSRRLDRLEKQGVFDPLLTDESGYTRMQNTSKIGEPKKVLFNYPKIELPFRSASFT